MKVATSACLSKIVSKERQNNYVAYVAIFVCSRLATEQTFTCQAFLSLNLTAKNACGEERKIWLALSGIRHNTNSSATCLNLPLLF